MVKINVLDLTVDQVEAIEVALGLPVDRWQDYPSRIAVLRRMYAAGTGTDAATVGAMTMRQLAAAVDMGDEEDDETADPTVPAPPAT